MDSATRQANLRALLAARFGALDDAGAQARLAERVGLSAGRISQLLAPGATFGERSARRIEVALRLAKGWLDRAPTGNEPIPEPPDLEAALHVVLQRLPGLDTYTADKVMTAMQAAIKERGPLDVIKSDLIALLSEPPSGKQTGTRG